MNSHGLSRTAQAPKPLSFVPKSQFLLHLQKKAHDFKRSDRVGLLRWRTYIDSAPSAPCESVPPRPAPSGEPSDRGQRAQHSVRGATPTLGCKERDVLTAGNSRWRAHALKLSSGSRSCNALTKAKEILLTQLRHIINKD